jgi:hypothetical protein
MYTRASASDYDDWERFGNPGWGSKDLIPLAEKVRPPTMIPCLSFSISVSVVNILDVSLVVYITRTCDDVIASDMLRVPRQSGLVSLCSFCI